MHLLYCIVLVGLNSDDFITVFKIATTMSTQSSHASDLYNSVAYISNYKCLRAT